MKKKTGKWKQQKKKPVDTGKIDEEEGEGEYQTKEWYWKTKSKYRIINRKEKQEIIDKKKKKTISGRTLTKRRRVC